jgi:hypothetical protein
MYQDFPFHCPACGSLSSQITGAVGEQKFTKHVCLRCYYIRTSAASNPTDQKPAASSKNARVNQILADSFLAMKHAGKIAGQKLSSLKDSTTLPGDVRLRMATSATCAEEEARSLIRTARTNASDQLKPYVAPRKTRHAFNERGYPIILAEDSEEVQFLEKITKHYFELVGKHYLEAGWGALRNSKNELIGHHLVGVTCTSCSQGTYAWTSAPNRESMRTEETLCSKCLDVHIDKICAQTLG